MLEFPAPSPWWPHHVPRRDLRRCARGLGRARCPLDKAPGRRWCEAHAKEYDALSASHSVVVPFPAEVARATTGRPSPRAPREGLPPVPRRKHAPTGPRSA